VNSDSLQRVGPPILRSEQGEHTAKIGGMLSLVDSDRPFTPEELEQLRSNIARLSDDGVRRLYETAWNECRPRGDRLAPPKSIQQ
jgi:hypothetical protein